MKLTLHESFLNPKYRGFEIPLDWDTNPLYFSMCSNCGKIFNTFTVELTGKPIKTPCCGVIETEEVCIHYGTCEIDSAMKDCCDCNCTEYKSAWDCRKNIKIKNGNCKTA